jgi:hypothetical protein
MSDCEGYKNYEEIETFSIKEREYKIGTCYSCQKCLYCDINLTIIENECSCNKTLKPTNNKTKKIQTGFVRNGKYDPNTCHSVLINLLQSSNDLYGYNSNFSKKFNFTLCAKCNSQLTRDQNTYNKNEENKSKSQVTNGFEKRCNQILTKKKLIIKQSDKHSELNDVPNSDISFRFKLVIKMPDSTKPAKAITLEKKPDDYYEFDDLVLQKVCEAVGLLVRNEYELSYKTEKGVGSGTILEEEEDFEEFMKEYYRLTSSNKVLLIIVTIQKKETVKRKKVHIYFFNFYLFIIILIYYIFN